MEYYKVPIVDDEPVSVCPKCHGVQFRTVGNTHAVVSCTESHLGAYPSLTESEASALIQAASAASPLAGGE